MATLSKGHTFSGGETVTAAKLNSLVDSATISGIVNSEIDASAAIALSKLATGALPSGITVASANLVDGTIVNADISNSAAIALAKLATGALPSGITVASANLVDGTIVDADISASAEIAVSKLADGAARQLLQTDAAGTGVEWTNNVDLPGTLDVTGAATLDSTLTVAGATTLNGNLTMGDADNIAFNTATGTKIGTAVGQKLAFYNATPIVQPSGANQAALTNSTGGTADGTLVAVSGTGDDADINNNFTELHVLLNEIRTALVNLGLIKGAA